MSTVDQREEELVVLRRLAKRAASGKWSARDDELFNEKTTCRHIRCGTLAEPRCPMRPYCPGLPVVE